MKKHIETLVSGLYHYVSFDGRFLMIKGRKIRVKGKVSILPWQGGQGKGENIELQSRDPGTC